MILTELENLRATLEGYAEIMEGLQARRDKLIRGARAGGSTLETIARAAGLTRARVHQIVKAGNDG